MSTTAHERIITRLREPGWHPAYSFGNDYHKLSSRVSELNMRGWNIVSRRRRVEGRYEWQYRMASIV